MRVLQIGKYLPPPYAGIEAHMHDLMMALSPEVSCTLLAATEDAAHPLLGQSEPYRVLAARCYGSVASVPLAPAMYFMANKEIDGGRADILHLHPPNPWGDFLAIRNKKKLPTIMTWHSDIIRQKRLMKMYAGVQQAALDACTLIFVPTPKHYESSTQLKTVDVEKKIRVVPFGIDFEGYDRTPIVDLPEHLVQRIGSRRMVLTVGRHVSYKGYDVLVKAFRLVDPDSVLVFVGSGPLTESLKTAAQELGIGDRVIFLGRVDPVLLVNLIRRAAVFCLPSVTQAEAFGLATAEAMSMGCPAVVCELSNGVNYLNRPGETGLTVEVGNVGQLADAITTLVRDPALAQKMGAQARNWVRSEFSPFAMRTAALKAYGEAQQLWDQ